MKDLPKIRCVARSVRKWAESNYSRKKTLAGYCAICSYRIFLRLKKLGIPCEFVKNKKGSHCFIMVGNYIVDVTATQFGGYPKVNVCKAERFMAGRNNVYWTAGVKARDPRHIKVCLKLWPKEQIPHIVVDYDD